MFKSSEKLSFAADRNKYRSPHSNIMQRVRNLGILTLKKMSIKSLRSGPGYTIEKEAERV